MSELNISVNPREEVGRGSNRRLRTLGKFPGVIYSKGESRSISLDSKDFAKLRRELIGRTPLVTLNEGKEETQALIQDIQVHPIKDYFIHVDFYEVTRGEEMTAHAALHVIGEASGVKNEGGNLEIHQHEIEVKARPSNIPDFIQIDVTDLKVGDMVHVGDLPKLDGVTYHLHEDTVLISVSGVKVDAVIEAEEEEAAADAAEATTAADKTDSPAEDA